MVKAIIFDLDGTLCDTLDDIRDGVNAVLSRLGYKQRTRSEIHQFINHGARNLIKRSLPEDIQDVDFIVESALSDYNHEYGNYYCNNTSVYEGIDDMLTELKSLGFKLGILSNKQDIYVKGIANELFDDDIFTCVMGQANHPPKPNPAAVNAIAKALGVRPDKCVMVGDSDVDVKTALNSGTKFVGVNWGYRTEQDLKNAGATLIASVPNDIVNFAIDFVKESLS
jgi:phosphoglycolate phosphatase